MGYDLTEPVRQAVLGLFESAWAPAIRQDGEERAGALGGRDHRPPGPRLLAEGTRVIARRERPHPGARLSFSDHDGPRFLATLTYLPGDPVELERMHRARVQHRDRVRAATQPAWTTCPSATSTTTPSWLQLSLIAQHLIALTQLLALHGDLAICEPALPAPTHAARLAFHARQATLR